MLIEPYREVKIAYKRVYEPFSRLFFVAHAPYIGKGPTLLYFFCL
jgi:hypothetical protein